MKIRPVSLAIALALGAVAAYAQNPYGGQFHKAAYSNQNSRALVQDVQRMLAELGYDPGPADGAMGERTRSAIRKYQGHSGFRQDGVPSESLRTALAADLGYPAGSTGQAPTVPATPAPTTTTTPATSPQIPRYSSNYQRRPANPDLDRLVTRLSGLIDEAEQQSAADPRFLEDLRAALAETSSKTTTTAPVPAPAPAPVVSAPVTPPPRQALLDEDFADRDFSRNPKWRIATGDFTIDRYGMRSQVQKPIATSGKKKSKNEIPLAVLGALLGGQSSTKQSAAGANPAEAYVQTTLPAGLLITARIVQLSDSGQFEFGLFRASSLGNGLRVQLHAGANAKLKLYRFQSGRGSLKADSRAGRISTRNGRSYEFEWRRSADGRTEIRLDGRTVLSGQDSAGERGFEGFVLRNDLGDFALESVRIERS